MFDGTTWVNVGNDGLTIAGAGSPILAISPADGEPYVAYNDNFGVSLKKFDGTNWVYVGTPGFSGMSTYIYLHLAFNSSGQPLMVFEDLQWLKAIVMKFDGTNWLYLGPADGFSVGESQYTGIAVNQTEDKPYVVYADGADSLKLSVMKYDSVVTGIREINNSRVSLYPNPASKTITIDLHNLPANFYCVEIFTLEGIKMSESQTGVRKVVLDIENYPDGIYIVKVKTDSLFWVGKFCKE